MPATDEVSPFAAIAEEPAIATTHTENAENAENLSDDDFVFARPPSAVRNLIATVTGSRRNIVIAAAGSGLLVLVCAFAFCGGGSSGTKKQVASNKSTASGANAAKAEAEPAPEPVETAPTGSGSAEAPSDPSAPSGPTPEELAAAAADSGEPPLATAEPGPEPKRDTGKPANAATTAIAKPAPKKPTIGGKQVVLEYDTQARDTKRVASAPKSDQGAIQKARAAYASGNQRLFAGDPAGAIRFYRQSLGHYPGYVAGYRGLGLAYAQRKDKANALRALRMYVSSVPTAKDVPLIRKRIKTLEGK